MIDGPIWGAVTLSTLWKLWIVLRLYWYSKYPLVSCVWDLGSLSRWHMHLKINVVKCIFPFIMLWGCCNLNANHHYFLIQWIDSCKDGITKLMYICIYCNHALWVCCWLQNTPQIFQMVKDVSYFRKFKYNVARIVGQSLLWVTAWKYHCIPTHNLKFQLQFKAFEPWGCFIHLQSMCFYLYGRNYILRWNMVANIYGET